MFWAFGQVYYESIEYRISIIEPNSGIDKYRRNELSNQHYSCDVYNAVYTRIITRYNRLLQMLYGL